MVLVGLTLRILIKFGTVVVANILIVVMARKMMVKENF
jgi:hypothetical protein